MDSMARPWFSLCSRHEVPLKTIAKAYRFKLYPNKAQQQDLLRFSGSCRWLWNQLLELNIETHKATGKFVFRMDMQKLLPGMKEQTPWLADTPAGALQRVCRNLDLALKRSFKPDAAGKYAGFPKFKKRGGERSFYVTNQQMRIEVCA